ncbi:hypothetical protein AAG589_09995 [Isoptericola sp. F-RaC21]|uniref:hypothetical protein n=1 Tax=Isoptericola sp. F-RaC21 TaxID=3141452 RepID=UPI00315B809C
MPARAVVLPGTPLLVPGAGGGTDLLGEVRLAVDGALDRLVADVAAHGDGDAPLVVLAPVPRGASGGFGRRRPSLAGAGVADRWVPAVAGWAGAADPAAHVPASVALVALHAALERAGHPAQPVAVLEVAGAAPAAPAEGVAALRRAPAVVVAGGAAPGASDTARDETGDVPADAAGLGPVRLEAAVAALLDGAVAPSAWTWRVTTVAGGHEHLPAAYGIAEGGVRRPGRD